MQGHSEHPFPLSHIRHALQGPEAGGRAPIYLRLRHALREALHEGRIKPSVILPCERELASSLDVARMTVRKAINGLVDEGLLRRHRGAGTFAADRIAARTVQTGSFSEDAAARGMVSSSRWLERGRSRVTPTEALHFGFSPGTEIYRLRRVRFRDGRPACIDSTSVATHCLSSADGFEESLYQAMQKQGCRPVRTVQRLRAVRLVDEEMDLLDCADQPIGLLCERRGLGSRGETVEYGRTVYRSDAYEAVIELRESAGS